MRFVVDNTNPTPFDRARYIKEAKRNRYNVIGYFFDTTLEDALFRNQLRKGKELIPEKGIRATMKKLIIPKFDEGFDELFRVTIMDNKFSVTPM